MSTMSAREFNQDVSDAKRRAASGPLIITDRGEPAYVLLTMADYRRLGESGEDLLDRLSMDDDVDEGFEPPRVDPGLRRVPEL